MGGTNITAEGGETQREKHEGSLNIRIFDGGMTVHEKHGDWRNLKKTKLNSGGFPSRG